MRPPRTSVRQVSKRRVALMAGAALVLLVALVNYTQLTALTLSGLADRLRASGASVAIGGEVHQPFFSPVGRFLTVNGEDVQVFEYALTPLAGYEASKVAPDGMGVGNAVHIAWLAPPHFYAVGRIIVVYLGMNRPVMQLLSAILGPPFVGSECTGAWSAIGGCQSSSATLPVTTLDPLTRIHGVRPDDIPLFVRVTFTPSTTYEQAVATLEMGPNPREPYPWTCDEPQTSVPPLPAERSAAFAATHSLLLSYAVWDQLVQIASSPQVISVDGTYVYPCP